LKTGLNSSLEIVRSRLSPLLCSEVNLERIREIASRLPPVHRAGFEYQLKQNITGLDFQQAVRNRKVEIGSLNSWAQSGLLPLPGKQRSSSALLNLVETWQDENSLANQIVDQLWLEFDCGDPVKSSGDPSVFLGFPVKSDTSLAHFELISQVFQILTGRKLPPETAATLQPIFELADQAGGVSHAGFMLSRNSKQVRMILPMPNRASAKKLLNHAHGYEIPANLDKALNWLFERFKTLRLCLDIGSSISQRIGLECSLNTRHAADQNADLVFDQLIARNLCTEQEKEALMAWPGLIYPGSGSAPWPDEMIIHSLLQDSNRFNVIDCRLSHLKFNLATTGILNAKAYFGYFENWIES